MLSLIGDDRRGWVAGICLVALLACGGWWAYLHETGAVGYGSLVDEPASRHGQQVSLSLFRVAAVEGVDRFAVEKGTLRIDVLGDSTDLVLGENLSLGGRWNGTAEVLELAWVERRHAGRRAKRVLGVLGLLLVAGLLGRSVTLGSGGLALRG